MWWWAVAGVACLMIGGGVRLISQDYELLGVTLAAVGVVILIVEHALMPFLL